MNTNTRPLISYLKPLFTKSVVTRKIKPKKPKICTVHTLVACKSNNEAEEVGRKLISGAVASGDRVIIIGHQMSGDSASEELIGFTDVHSGNGETLLHLLFSGQNIKINLNEHNTHLMDTFVTHYTTYINGELGAVVNDEAHSYTNKVTRRQTRIFLVNTLPMMVNVSEVHAVLYAMSRALRIAITAIGSYNDFQEIDMERFRSITANAYALALLPVEHSVLDIFNTYSLGNRASSPIRLWLLSHGFSQAMLILNGKCELKSRSRLFKGN